MSFVIRNGLDWIGRKKASTYQNVSSPYIQTCNKFQRRETPGQIMMTSKYSLNEKIAPLETFCAGSAVALGYRKQYVHVKELFRLQLILGDM